MEIKKLETASLSDALKKMAIGEVCKAPDGYSPQTVIKACCELKSEGYMFYTSRRAGEQVVTRIK